MSLRRAQLIVDCGGRVMSAILATANGDLIPWSQQIQGVATRHVSLQLLFDPRASEHADFSWEEEAETLLGTGPRNLLLRARRLGLRRPWDAPAEALLLKSPLAVLSFAPALADPAVKSALPAVSEALLAALFEPLFSFTGDRVAAADVDPIVILPASAGYHARLTLHRIFRRHGHRRVTILHREHAVAMALAESPPQTCVVCDLTGDDLHLHTVSIEADRSSRSFTTVASSTIRGLGWRYWVQQIASALEMPWPAADRSLTSLLTGSPDTLPRLTHASLDAACNAQWCEQKRAELAAKIHFQPGQKIIFAGEICAVDAVRQVLGPDELQTPHVDRAVRAAAAGALWLHGDPHRTISFPLGGSISVNSFRNGAVPVLTAAQFPPPGASCSIAPEFRVRGGSYEEHSFVVHLLYGTDEAAEGNSTLCAIPATADSDRSVRFRLHVRRSRSGRRLSGFVEIGSARASFAEEAAFIGRAS